MNIYTKQIAQLLGITLELAMQVQDRMIIDFSECTQAEFDQEARFIHSMMEGETWA